MAPGLPAVAGLPAVVQSAKRRRFARLQANKKKKQKPSPPLHSFGSSAVGQNGVVLADCSLQSKIDCRRSVPVNMEDYMHYGQ